MKINVKALQERKEKKYKEQKDSIINSTIDKVNELSNYLTTNTCVKCWNLPAKINGKYIMKVVEI